MFCFLFWLSSQSKNSSNNNHHCNIPQPPPQQIVVPFVCPGEWENSSNWTRLHRSVTATSRCLHRQLSMIPRWVLCVTHPSVRNLRSLQIFTYFRTSWTSLKRCLCRKHDYCSTCLPKLNSGNIREYVRSNHSIYIIPYLRYTYYNKTFQSWSETGRFGLNCCHDVKFHIFQFGSLSHWPC